MKNNNASSKARQGKITVSTHPAKKRMKKTPTTKGRETSKEVEEWMVWVLVALIFFLGVLRLNLVVQLAGENSAQYYNQPVDFQLSPPTR